MTIQDLKEKNLLLLECISGSKAYGLNTATSDTDIKGVYYIPKEQFYGLKYVPQVNNETNDEVYYELGRFIELLGKNNPNILELLATPADCVLYRHPIMERINPAYFLSKLCKETFAGYAASQIKKARGLNKKIVNPMEKERKSVLDFCFTIEGATSTPLKEWLQRNDMIQENCGLSKISHTKGLFALYYDEKGKLNYSGIQSSDIANEVSLSSMPAGEQLRALVFFNLESYSSYCKEYREYWEWVEKRNETRYLGNKAHGKDYDAKNMMHTIRLLQMAKEIALTGKIEVRRQNRAELLDIKAGKLDYDELLQLSDTMLEEIELAYTNSSLPDTPDHDAIEQLLVKMRKELYRI
ncbi:MAG: nucleotidyltransferase domain-containing protein [Filimonas sp.]|nr:nucleotidyltransferase domain-containing protein [Filimonas sp.]